MCQDAYVDLVIGRHLSIDDALRLGTDLRNGVIFPLPEFQAEVVSLSIRLVNAVDNFVQNGTFVAGRSAVLTIEQVYYRYTAANKPPYGRLERYVRYANTPDNTFPPTSISWVLIADHLTDFSLEYRNVAGSALTGSPLSAANRDLVRSIFILMEGFDDAGPQGSPRTFQAETQVLVRNPSAGVLTALDLL